MRRYERRLRRERIIVAAARSRRFLVEEYGRLEGEDAPLAAAPTEGADYRSCGSQPHALGWRTNHVEMRRPCCCSNYCKQVGRFMK